MRDDTLDLADGRTVGFCDWGPPDGIVVVWCHGGPGSRLDPAHVAVEAANSGLRMVGIDRPGYGSSTPQPGRSIGDWVADAVAVVDHLAIDRFVTVGTSTGGAYALAVAAMAPERVAGVVACCAMTDMRCAECRATMSTKHAHAVWDAPDRTAALAAADEAHGQNGKTLVEDARSLPPTDRDLFADPAWLATAGGDAMFAQGNQGYVDDRIADRPGWVSFEVGAVGCPVVVLHGGCDVIVPLAQARHTARLVANVEMRIFDDLGHFSIISQVIPAIHGLLDQ